MLLLLLIGGVLYPYIVSFSQSLKNLASIIWKFIASSQKFLFLALLLVIIFFIARKIHRKIEGKRIHENLEIFQTEEENTEAYMMLSTNFFQMDAFELKTLIAKMEKCRLKEKVTLENKEEIEKKITEVKKYLKKLEAKREKDIRLEEQKRKREMERFRERKDVNINVNEDDGLFDYEKLSEDEVEYLSRKDYVEFEGLRLNSKKRKKYLIRPRFNESPQHCFLVYDIKKYLEKFTDKVWLYETKKPDIVLDIKRKIYAIEVETGKALKYHRKLLMEKVKNLNRDYPKRWFFVLTNKKLTSRYNKLGNSCDRRTLKNRIDKILKGT